MPQRDENNFSLVCLEIRTALLPKSKPVMSSPSTPGHCTPLVSPLSSTDSPQPWHRTGLSVAPQTVENQQEILHKQLLCTTSLMGTSCHCVKLLAQDVLPKYLQLPPTKRTSNCSHDSQPRSSTFTPNPFHRSCWWALSGTIRLGFWLSDSNLRGGMEQHTVSIIAELKYIIFQLRFQN